MRMSLSTVHPVVTLPVRPSGTFAVRRLGTGLRSVLRTYRRSIRGLVNHGSIDLSLYDGVRGKGLHISRNIVTNYTNNLCSDVCRTTSVLGNRANNYNSCTLDICPNDRPVVVRLIHANIVDSLVTDNTAVHATFYNPYFNTNSIPTGNTLSVHRAAHGFPDHRNSGPNGNRLSNMTLVSTHDVTTAATGNNVLAPTASVSCSPAIPRCRCSPSDCGAHICRNFNGNSCSTLLGLNPGVGS